MAVQGKGPGSKKWAMLLLASSLFITGSSAFGQAADNTPASGDAPAAAPADGGSSQLPSLTYTPGPGGNSDQVAQNLPAAAAPAPLQDGDAGSGTAADGTQVAQATNPASPRRIDPAWNRLPLTKGTVKIRRQFKLFAKEELIHNLSFRDTPVREVLGELARRGNLNVLLDKSVVGKITGDLHDVTLNEAMDSVLAAAGLTGRTLDNNSVIVGSPNAMVQLGLNRSMARVFKISYASPFDVANLLYASVFNRGIVPDFTSVFKRKETQAQAENPKSAESSKSERAQVGVGEGGAQRRTQADESSSVVRESKEEQDTGVDYQFSSRLDTQRPMRGVSRWQVTEGTGFNNAAQDPGTQQIRATVEVPTDFNVEQNGGGAIVIPDMKNRQVVVVGTPDDLAVAEECIRLLDQRPRQVHIQVSLVELRNEGIRQLGAALNLQSQGASANVLGGSFAPLINLLPGLGSPGTQSSGSTATAFDSADNLDTLITGVPPVLTTFSRAFSLDNTYNTQRTVLNRAPVSTADLQNPFPSTGFLGFLGNFFPQATLPNIAGVRPLASAQTGFNFLTLGKKAGGRDNIATIPTGVNFTVNMLLQTNKAKVLANPSVVVSDNTESLITLATEVIHKVTSTVSLGVTNVNVELTKAGVFLDVLPRVAEDGFISMRIRPQVSAPVGPEQRFANDTVIVTLLNIREVMTQEVRVKDGQTLVLGGLFTEQEAAQIAKVPYLAETPLFGALFRNTLKGRNRTELMLMITPKVVEESPAAPPPLADSGAGGARM